MDYCPIERFRLSLRKDTVFFSTFAIKDCDKTVLNHQKNNKNTFFNLFATNQYIKLI